MPEEKGRDTWGGRLDFLLSCVGLAVGLGNIWRFPYLCYKNGGGAFLFSYLIILLLCAFPLYLLEVSLGQYMGKGGIGVWDICPLFKGIGICATVILSLGSMYYNIITSWALYYLYSSFTTILPWSHCNNEWNTPRCKGQDTTLYENASDYQSTMSSNLSNLNDGFNSTVPLKDTYMNMSRVDPVVEFWERRVLEMSSGMEHPGGLVLHLAVCLFLAWFIVCICVMKGVRITGKLVYFTSTFPYVMLFFLLIRALTLPGAMTGIYYYVFPRFHKLLSPQVWIDAGTQVLFSYGLGLNCLVTLGSFNKFNNRYIFDSIVVMTINSCTSITAGFAVFSILGFMATQDSTTMDEVVQSGPGLVFIAVPKAVSEMHGGPIISVLFFFMIVLVGLSTLFVGVQSIATIICDGFPMLQKRYGREIVTIIFCCVTFCVGLTMVTRGGIYVLQLFDYYSCSGMAMLWVCFFQCIAVSWVFGINKYSDAVQLMTGQPLNLHLRISLTFVAPVILAGLYVWLWYGFELLSFGGTYVYPAWAQIFGLCLAFSSMLCVPIYAVYKLIVSPGETFTQKWNHATTPILNQHQVPHHWHKQTEKNGIDIIKSVPETEILLTKHTILPN